MMSAIAPVYVNCRRCRRSILQRTADRNGGLCACCVNPHNSLGLLENLQFALLVAATPFLLLFLFAKLGVDYLARFVPGTRANLLKRLQAGWRPEPKVAFRIWSRAPGCFAGPYGFSAVLTPEYLLLNQVTQDAVVDSQTILAAIDHRSPMLAAYCIEVLEHRRELQMLAGLPAAVRDSKAKIKWYCVFVVEMELGQFLNRAVNQLQAESV